MDNSKKKLKQFKKSLTQAQCVWLESVLKKHATVFLKEPLDLETTILIYQKIDTGESAPLIKGMRRIQQEQITILKAQVDKLQNLKAIKLSISPLASYTILVKKKCGSMRLCINNCHLNAFTKKECASNSSNRRHIRPSKWSKVLFDSWSSYGLPLNLSSA